MQVIVKALALALLSSLSARVLTVHAATTITTTNQYAYGANVGWLDWRGDVAHGVEVGPTCCAGYVYGANLGWICLGSGAPTNGVQYQNLSASDYGVNVDPFGNLRGYAWGANVGWINFEATGTPRVDFGSGALSGYAWGANVGWISLSNAVAFVQTTSLAPANDLCAGAIPLTNGTSFSMSTLTATSAADPLPSCAGAFGKGVWFTYTPLLSGDVTVSTCGSSFNTVLQVFAGFCGSFSPLQCADDNGPACSGAQASLSFPGNLGTTYYILAGGYNSASGALNILVTSPLNAGSAPVLNVSQSGANLTLTWPGGGNLEAATNLATPISWAVVTNGGLWSEPMTNPVKFFRVKQ